jgi:ribonuclease HII
VIVTPTYQFERALHKRGARFVIGCDEVGRGAIAGPVAVGMVVVDAGVGRMPVGLRDSKMLSEPHRERLAPLCASWVRASAVGLATAAEVDELGIIVCLGLAGSRALAALRQEGAPVATATVILDGNHDYLTSALNRAIDPAATESVSVESVSVPEVVTRIKADQTCASVAAASVIAKVHRDRMMIDRDVVTPGYGWATNKGYGSVEHFAALARLGPSDIHRLTWLKQPAA